MEFTSVGNRLLAAIEKAKPALIEITDEAAAIKPDPSKWSKKEIIGHLIDSASNNHQRFVRALWQENLIFQGYQQDGWVEAQGYNEANWADLIDLWYGFNFHLARYFDRIPASIRDKEYLEHCFDQIAFRSIPKSQSATLGYFMNDYIDHLEHHLTQIFGG